MHGLTPAEAEQVLRLQRPVGQEWAPEYPSLEQIDYLQAFLVESRSLDTSPYWQAQIQRQEDGLVIGGAGVTGPPDDRGAVVIGYEIMASVPEGSDYDIEVVRALVDVAERMGARFATTTTREDDDVRRGAYLRAGLTEVRRDEGTVHLSIDRG